MVFIKCNDFVNHLYIGISASLGFANLFRIATAFGDEIQHVKHR